MSQSIDKQKITNFLRGCFLRGECERIELRHITQQGAQRVYQWVIADEPEASRTPEAFADMIDEAAMQDAQGMRGPARYAAYVFRTGKNDPEYRIPFMKRGELSDDGSFAETEEPDKTGLTSMAMRHSEASTRMMLQGMGQIFSLFQRQITEQSEQIKEYNASRIQMFEMLEKLTSGVEERRLAAKKAEREDEIRARLLDQTQMIVPAVMAKLLPGKAGKEIVAVESVRQFMKSLRPEQLEKLADGLDEGQQMAMITLYQTFLAEEEAKEKKAEGAA